MDADSTTLPLPPAVHPLAILYGSETGTAQVTWEERFCGRTCSLLLSSLPCRYDEANTPGINIRYILGMVDRRWQSTQLEWQGGEVSTPGQPRWTQYRSRRYWRSLWPCSS